MLRADGLGKSYQAVQAVESITLEVRPGSIVGLVGNNGAGKSTTLKMLCGLIEPSRGTATVAGRPTLEPATRAMIGYLPEDTPLYEEQTAIACLAFFGGLYGLSRRASKQRAEHLLRRLRLDEGFWRKPIGELSKGSARKVAIARALLHDPPVLILDEPASGLDPATRRELDQFLLELCREGKAILLSAHNLRQVEEMCDSIVLLHQGRVAAQGSLAALRQSFGTPRYRLHADRAFTGSAAHGPLHVGEVSSPEALERALAEVRSAGGTPVEVESLPPSLDDILRRVAV
ncbi:MAG: ABC transporter ATP-binding protein [Candidatus Thermoplasmatota archaeon]